MDNEITIATRFGGYLPIVIDIETAGFNPIKDALLEIAAVFIEINAEQQFVRGKTIAHHVLPFPKANLDPAALKFTGIDPYHPFRFAVTEKVALNELFTQVRTQLKKTSCRRAVLVGHNAAFDLSFINAAIQREKLKHTPFHRFTTFDTATLGALAVGETVLAKAVAAAGLEFDAGQAHSAIYDAEITADLFCYILNRWHLLTQT